MIIHADMDAFYASVEIREQPELAHQPVAVGGSAEGRGVISAANYIARQFGVHSAMPTATAKRLCPKLVLLPGRMSLYVQVSQQIREIFQRFTPVIEPLSLDEAFLDVYASEKLFGSARSIGQQIKQSVLDELRLVVSIGIAPNKFVAKIASDIDKPDGFIYVAKDGIQDFLDPLPIKRLWGVGKVTENTLKTLGIQTVRDLRLQPKELLQNRFGEHGLHLWDLAHGIDPRSVISDHEAKSISHEMTFPTDIDDRDILLAELLHLTEQVARRLRYHHLQGRTVQLKVRYSDFTTLTRSHTIDNPTDVTQLLWHTVKSLFQTKLPKKLPPVRLIGMGVSGFESQDTPQQQDFFTANSVKQEHIDEITDAIKDKFGTNALHRATSFIKPHAKNPSRKD